MVGEVKMAIPGIANRFGHHGFRFHNSYGLNHNHRGQVTCGDALLVHFRATF